jgi:UDP-glucuronate 4-epimerase
MSALGPGSTILVTGAAGFIGARTAATLLEQGHQVVGVDNLNDYYDVRLKQHRLDGLLALPGFSFRALDIEDLPALQALFKEKSFDAVLNLAARAGVRYSIENPHVYMTTNAHGTLNILEAMRAHDVSTLVLASTSSLYAGEASPFTEDMPVNRPLSPYAASKKAAEAMAYSYHHLFDMNVSVVRYFTVYGPAGRPDMSPFRFIRWIAEGEPIQLYGDGSAARDFTFVDDIARGTIAAASLAGHHCINLGGGDLPISINAMIALIEGFVGKKARIDRLPTHRADMDVTWANIQKAGDLLDWRPQVDFEEGIRRSVAWYMENRDWARGITS